MIIKQTFVRGNEEKCGEEFFSAFPVDLEMEDALKDVLDVIYRGITYQEYFVIQVDTEKKTAEVIDIV